MMKILGGTNHVVLLSPSFVFHFARITGPMFFSGRCGPWNGEQPDAVRLLIGNRVVRCRRTPCGVGLDVSTFRFDALFSTSGGVKWVCVQVLYGNKVRNGGHYLVYNKYPVRAAISSSMACPIVKSYSNPAVLIEPPESRTPARIAVVLHLFYSDLWPEFSRLLANIREPFDLYVTVCEDCDSGTVACIASEFPRAKVLLVANRGRDILPFLDVLRMLSLEAYRFICKIHSKKSPHRRDGGHNWRNALLSDLLGSPETVSAMLAAFESDPALGLVAPWDNLPNYSSLPGESSTQNGVMELRGRMQAQQFSDFPFPKGSMFWARMSALEPLLAADIRPEEFAHEAGQMDGTMAHAIERVFGLSAIKAGCTCEEAPELLPSE